MAPTRTTPAIRAYHSLAALEAQDPTARPANGRGERRFHCPDCRDLHSESSGRTLAVNAESGAYHCHRCGAKGLLLDAQTRRAPSIQGERRSSRQIVRERLLRAATLPPERPAPPAARRDGDYLKIKTPVRMVPLADPVAAPAVAYLEGRSIPHGLAAQAGAMFAPEYPGWPGGYRPCVFWPVVDAAGSVIAGQARRLDGDADKCRSQGPISGGCFETPGAWSAPRLIVTEAPLDALSLALCGFPAVALCGKSLPDAVAARCVGREVMLAYDADTAGDEAAETARAILYPRTRRVHRLRPAGAKDWNDLLQMRGREWLASWLSGRLQDSAKASDFASALEEQQGHSAAFAPRALAEGHPDAVRLTETPQVRQARADLVSFLKGCLVGAAYVRIVEHLLARRHTRQDAADAFLLASRSGEIWQEFPTEGGGYWRLR